MTEVLSRFGYLGVWLGVFLESTGVPVPGETVLIGAAFASAHKLLSLPAVIGTAVLAAVMGDSLGYALGRLVGRPWVEEHGRWLLLTPQRLDRVDRFFDRFGPVAVAMARFVTGVRVIAAFSAGMGRMRWPLFFRWNLLGALAWAIVVGFGGYALGSGWRSLRAAAGTGGAIALLVVPAGLFSLYAFWRLRGRGRPTRILRVGAPVWIWGVGFCLAALGIFARVAEEVLRVQTIPLDGNVRGWALAHQEPILAALSRGVTWIGSPWVLAPVTLGVVVFLLRRRGPTMAGAVASVPLVTGFLIFGLKRYFERATPPGASVDPFFQYSFPSGHTTAVTAVLVGMAYVSAREGFGGLWLMGISLGLSLLVGAGRVYLDAQWATDVLGGWMVGVYLAALTAAAYEGARMRHEP
jgi:membrane protein DedA with SNARE-associated domain/membrane-associated phospholipid phosphatase